MEAAIKGGLSGLAYGLLLGPLFFLGLKTTLGHGLRNGIALAIGAFLSDALLVLGSWWGAARVAAVVQGQVFQSVFGLASGLLLLGFGISAVWPRKRTEATHLQVIQKKPLPISFLQGFVVNLSNPSNWLFWIGLATAARAESLSNSGHYTHIFLTATLLSVFCTDIIKVFLADRMGRRMSPDFAGRVIHFAGVILILVSVWILWKVIFKTG